MELKEEDLKGRKYSDLKSACDVGDQGSIPGLGSSSGEGNGNPLQYSCLENPMDGEALAGYSSWDHKSRTQLSAVFFF